MRKKLTWNASLVLLPGVAFLTFFLFLPMANIVDESLREFVPGSVGSRKDASFSLQNYAELVHPAYFGFLLDTFRIGLIATSLAIAISFPMAYFIARIRSGVARKAALGFLISMLFLSSAVRVYALVLTFGPIGLMKFVARALDVTPNSAAFAEFLVVIGLLHYAIPVAVLILVGSIQNVDPKLIDAAQSLGSSRSSAHFDITIPLSAKGILSAFAVCYTLSISSFIVPLILGRGKVVFLSNLIYSRFSEVANYPSGSAVSILMLCSSIVLIYGISRMLST